MAQAKEDTGARVCVCVCRDAERIVKAAEAPLAVSLSIGEVFFARSRNIIQYRLAPGFTLT